MDKTLRSGQVFRWRKEGSVWSGRDGTTWYRVAEPEPGSVEVESNALESDFVAYFSLDRSFRELANVLIGSHPEAQGALERQPGLRLCQPRSPEETLFCFLCTANNHLPRIKSMIGRLEALGETGFPTSAQIAGCSEASFRSLGFGYRSASLVRTAQQLLDRGDGWLESLKSESYATAFEELQSLPGVGPKLADCVCLYGLHFQEAVPVDTHLWQAAARSFLPEFGEVAITKKRYQAVGDAFRSRFGVWAGWAQLIFYYDHLEERDRARVAGPLRP